MKTKKIVFTALLSALICVLAPLSFQIGPIPISLATLAIYFVASAAELKISIPAVLVYIFLGAVGVPVFAGFQGGFQKLIGVTGGYIIGYLPCVLIIGLLLKLSGKKFMLPLAMVAGTVVLYLFGTVWFLVLTGKALKYALAVCVVPFLAGDCIKIAAVTALTVIVKPRLDKILAKQEA